MFKALFFNRTIDPQSIGACFIGLNLFIFLRKLYYEVKIEKYALVEIVD
jgi:hypothetical protein